MTYYEEYDDYTGKRKVAPRPWPLMILDGLGWMLRGLGSGLGWMLRGIATGLGYALAGTWFGLRWSLGGFWWSVSWLFHGAIVLLGWLWQALLWTLRAPFRLLRWAADLFRLRPLDFQNDYYGAMERLIRRRYRRRRGLVTHTFIWAGAGAVLIIDWLLYTSGWGRPALEPRLFALAAWAVLLGLHYIRIRISDAEDDAIRAMAEGVAPPLDDRQRAARLSDDGELIYYDFDDERKLKRRR
jgi:hypothetical protein